jgi:hypothetical protein
METDLDTYYSRVVALAEHVVRHGHDRRAVALALKLRAARAKLRRSGGHRVASILGRDGAPTTHPSEPSC